jgi:hypothetical protein
MCAPRPDLRPGPSAIQRGGAPLSGVGNRFAGLSGETWSGLDFGRRWGSGFLPEWAARPMLGARSFADEGPGGQFAFGDDEFGVGFGYVANRVIGYGDACAERLTGAVRRCVSG